MPQVVVPLTIRDLADEDLPWCRWSGSRSHLVSIAGAVKWARAERPSDDSVAVTVAVNRQLHGARRDLSAGQELWSGAASNRRPSAFRARNNHRSLLPTKSVVRSACDIRPDIHGQHQRPGQQIRVTRTRCVRTGSPLLSAAVFFAWPEPIDLPLTITD
jgi:hypothetical protein